MNYVFTTPGALTREFGLLLALWAIVAAVAPFLLSAASRATQRPVALRYASLAALLLYPFIVVLLYFSTVARFAAFSLNADRLVLRFGAPHSSLVVLLRSEIGEVLFGAAGKSASSGCFIKFGTRSHGSDRSETLQQPLQACKAMRTELLVALGRQ